MAGELSPDCSVVVLEELAPARIPELGRLRRRADDVGEENRGEDAVVFCPRTFGLHLREESAGDADQLIGSAAGKR
jgi:hypothetical protein